MTTTRDKRRHPVRAAAGFTILEVSIAASVALMVIFGIFSAIRTANEQQARVAKKQDEVNLLADLRFVLAPALAHPLDQRR